MNLRDLHYIYLVDKYKHFGQAAKEANVSQPALSMQVNKLEDFLGVEIFERSNRKVITTNIGKKIIKTAEEIINKADYIKDLAKISDDPFAGELKIGAFPTLAPYLFPNIIPNIAESFPKLQLYLVEDKTDDLVQKLKEGEIDLAFLALPIPEDNFEHLDLFSDRFYVAVSKNHKLANNKNVTKADIDRENILLLEEGHCLRDQALEFCTMLGTNPAQDFRGSSLETLRQMVAVGGGITLVPEIAIDDNPNIKYLPFKDVVPSRRIALFYRNSSARKKMFLELFTTLKELLA